MLRLLVCHSANSANAAWAAFVIERRLSCRGPVCRTSWLLLHLHDKIAAAAKTPGDNLVNGCPWRGKSQACVELIFAIIDSGELFALSVAYFDERVQAA